MTCAYDRPVGYAPFTYKFTGTYVHLTSMVGALQGFESHAF
jgi:hypothetical protein